jgi:hypothetical protein
MLEKLIAFDVWIMRSFFGGLAGETMSAAAWNAHITHKFFGFTYLFIDLIFYPLQRSHCQMAWEWQQDLYRGNT